jgi:BMFP domain-containing protein YqiC
MKCIQAMLMVTMYWTSGMGAHAQESSTAYFGDEAVEVSEEQADQIRDVEDEFTTELKPLEQQVEELTEKLVVKRKEFENKRLSLLTPQQREAMLAERFKSGEAKLRENQADDIRHLRTLIPILEKLQTRQSTTVLEGPQRTRMELPTAPADDPPVEHVGKHFFFKEPLVLNSEDELLFLSTATSYKSFSPFSGFKACGGFHPDANIRIANPNGTIQILVCFGCGEAVFIDGENRVLVDLEPTAYQTLRAVCVRNFRKRDPAARGGFFGGN